MSASGYIGNINNLPPGVSLSDPHINPPDEEECENCLSELGIHPITCRCCGNKVCEDCQHSSSMCAKCHELYEEDSLE